jgi:hypothetical protein
VNRLLSAKPVEFIGLISYSLYLWHWPLIVVSRQYAIDEPPPSVIAAALILAFLLSVATWRFIEKPFRHTRKLGRSGIYAAGAAAATCAVALGFFGHVSNGWPARLPPAATELAAFAESINPRRDECTSRARNWIEPTAACVYGAGAASRYALWGDSHADAIVFELGELASRNGQSVKYFSYEACPPVEGIRTRGNAEHRCLEYNDAVLSLLTGDSDIRTVFLVARHALYLLGRTTTFGPAEANEASPLTRDASGAELDFPERVSLYEAGLSSVVDALESAGKIVVLVYPVPEAGYLIPETLAKLVIQGRDPAAFVRPASFFRERNAAVFGILDGIGSASTVRLYPHELFCDEQECKLMGDGQPLYSDDDHLSHPGARLISPLFEELFVPASASSP